MAKEIERRFLVRSDSWREQADAGIHYLQGYLSIDPKRNVRIRIGGNEARLTIKGATKGITRPEFEYPVPIKDAEQLERLCLKPILEKTRYKVKRDGLTWEIDEYAAENKGLIVVEVETKSEAPLRKVPSWVGPEISGDRRYRNIDLVKNPFTKWGQDQPKPDIKYYLQSGEDLSQEIHRILNEQLDAAISELSNGKGGLDTSVHEARKSIKRTRSLLRLIRAFIPKIYASENRRLQGIGRKLSELRDPQALIETLQDLEKRQIKKKGHGAHPDFSKAYRLLRQRKDKIAKTAKANGDIEKAVRQLEQARTNLSESQLDKLDSSGIFDSLKTTIKRGEEAFSNAQAESTPENFHECRKRVKDLRYQLALLTEMWPEVFEVYVDSAKELEESLGNDHNLAVLGELLQKQSGNDANNSLRSTIEKKQNNLRNKALRMSGRIYSESAKTWGRRLEASWKIWDSKNGK